MPLYLIRTDITRFSCDAIVLGTDESLLVGGAVFGAIGSAVGPDFRTMLQAIGGCNTGDAKCVQNTNLPCKRLILTAAPTYRDGKSGEVELLRSCYTSALRLARRKGCRKIAVSLIDSHVYGFPTGLAQEIAVDAIEEYLTRHSLLEVYLVSFDLRDYAEHADLSRQLDLFLAQKNARSPVMGVMAFKAPVGIGREQIGGPLADVLEKKLAQPDESFQQALFRLIDERGMKDADCYRNANVTKATFSKIRSNPDYHPKKQTALAFAVALKLDLQETEHLLRTAGYALSKSSKSDIIVEFFIMKKMYNIGRINEFLYAYDQPLLGASN